MVFVTESLPGGFVYREWLPNAKQVFLIGEFHGAKFWGETVEKVFLGIHK